MFSNISAILFDSGRVLNRASTGHWFITPDFYLYVDRESFASIPKVKRDMAFSKAGAYISGQKSIENEEEEFKHFLEYYKIFFNNLPELAISEEKIELVARDLVFNYDKYKFYNDVTEVIPELAKGYKLAVVSDAWPSLDNVFKKAGLREYFSSFVISSVIGVGKPDETMYSTALKQLGVSPGQAIFVDDNIKNCDGARKLGIKSFLLCRDIRLFLYYKFVCKNHMVIRNLYDLKKYLYK